MRIEILGSGGAITTPRPGCTCRICAEARAKGLPYTRSGPGIFVHGPDLLIDTSEEIKDQLNRAGIAQVPACIYSHWHPDHTLGYRVWEALNGDWQNWPHHHRCTDIYLPPRVAHDFRRWLGAWDQYRFMEKNGLVRVIELAEGESIRLNGTAIRPVRLAQEYAYAFWLHDGDTRVLIAPDEVFAWEPPAEVCGLDVAVLPVGVFEVDPFTGDRLIPTDHPVLKSEATFPQTLDIVRKLDARRVILTHIGEPEQLSYDDGLRLADRLRGEGFDLTLAYDTMMIEF
jgi:phosphoribosyl 1,2-cyclic phosphate phosphodiesterase